MGTVIESLAVATPTPVHPHRSARVLEGRAARTCLLQAGVEAADVDLLVNAGIYREDFLGEPALAALIQEDLDANLGHPPLVGQRGTFSFDVLDGACGVLAAVEIADVLLRAGTIRRALVVAGDTKPRYQSEFPFIASAGAALLRWSDQEPGFVAHRSDTYPQHEDLYTTYVSWQPRANHLPGQGPGHNTLTIEHQEAFDEAVNACVSTSLGSFLDAQHLHLGPQDTVVVSGTGVSRGELQRCAQVGEARVVGVPDDLARSHTAGMIAAMMAAQADGTFQEAVNIVLLSAGAGITVRLAHYQLCS